MKRDGPLIDIINTHLTSKKVKLPPFNPTALRIQKEIVKEEPDIRLIEKLIIRDQSLTGELLRVSNSAFYRGLSQVSTVRDAIIRLGIKEISNIVTMVTHRHHFRSKDPQVREIMAILWRHSVACALGAHCLAKQTGFQHLSHELFIAALLHDVGKLFILTVIDFLKHSGEMSSQLSRAVIDEVMVSLHTDHGYTLMNHWNLPEEYCVVARDHHLEDFDPGDILLVIVRLSNNTCNKMGIGLREKPDTNLTATPEANLLHLSEVDLARLEVKLEDSHLFAG